MTSQEKTENPKASLLPQKWLTLNLMHYQGPFEMNMLQNESIFGKAKTGEHP